MKKARVTGFFVCVIEGFLRHGDR